MSKTVLTKGWKKPIGKCDICNTRPVTHWFGDTSVALCNDAQCAATNQYNWDKMCREMEEEEERRRLDW